MKTQFIKISILLLLSIIFISCSSSETKEDGSENLLPTTSYDISSILSKFDGIDAVSYAVAGNMVTFTTTDLPNHTSPYWSASHPLYEPYNGTNSNWNQNPKAHRRTKYYVYDDVNIQQKPPIKVQLL